MIIAETRNRGKATRSYVESHEASEDEGRFGKRQRVITSSSPIRNTRSHPASEPPVLRRPATISSEDESGNEDQNEPGPSSRLTRATRKSSQRAGNSRKNRGIRNVLEEDNEGEDEPDEDSENESESEDEENSDESDDDVNQHKSRAKKQSQQRPRRPLRPRQNGSDDDDYEAVNVKKTKVI